MKIPAIRTVGSTLVIGGSLVLFGGIASAQSIDTTGPDSTNLIRSDSSCRSTVDNDTVINVISNNPQDATSGDISADENTTVGGVGSGTASNTSDSSFGVVVSNDSGSACAPAATQTTSPETPGVAPTAPGGMGGGTVAEASQVVVPVGSVGAGAGGSTYVQALIAVTLSGGAWALARIRKLHHA